MFHLALAASFVVGPYVTLALIERAWPTAIAVLVGLAVGGGLSAGCEALHHRPLRRGAASDLMHILGSLAIYVVTVQLVTLAFGSEVRSIEISRASRTFGPLVIGDAQLLVLSGSLVVLFAYALLLRLGRIGVLLRALADAPGMLEELGFPAERLRVLVFALAGMGLALLGTLTAADLGVLPDSGYPQVILGFTAVVLGGRASWLGPVAGGFLLGMVRTFVAGFGSARWEDAVTLALLLAVLYLRPQGLFGAPTRLEEHDA